MKLKRITLVNWYLIDPVDIDVEGHVAIIGENTAGKSSLLDAIQTILFGGNQNKISFNAESSANRIKNARSIKTYSLGYFKPEEPELPSEQYRLRDECFSYLALSFLHDTKGYINIFVGIESRASELNVEFPLLSVITAPRALSKEDFIIEHNDGSYTPLKPSEVLERLAIFKANSKEIVTIETEKKASDYMKLVARALSPSSLGHKIDPDRLASVLSNSIKLKGLDNVSKFVQNFILDPKPLDTRGIRSQQKQYEELQAEIEKITQQIESISGMSQKAGKAIRLFSRAQSYKWLSLEKRNEDISNEEYELGEINVGMGLGLEKLAGDLEEAESEIAELEPKINTLAIEIGKDDSQQKIENLSLQIENLEANLVTIQNSEGALLKILRGIQAEDYQVLNLSAALSCAENIESSLRDIDERVLADEYIVTYLKLIKDVENAIERVRNAVYPMRQRQSELYQKYDDLINAVSHKSPLKRDTSTLIGLLAQSGIEANPVCHLAHITNEEWQPAIEALIGGDSEALIVAEQDEEAAYKVYRQARKYGELSRVKIVKASRIKTLDNRDYSGTAAEFIESDNSIALKFLRYKVSRFLRVESDSQLKHERFAITKDGMLSNDLTVSGMRLSEEKKFTQDHQANIGLWKRKRADAESELIKCNKAIQSVPKIENTCRALTELIEEGKSVSFSDYKDSIDSISVKVKSLTDQRDSIDIGYLSGLINQKNTLEEQLLAPKKQSKELPGKIAKLEFQIESNRQKIIEFAQQSESINQQQKEVSSHFFFDAELNDEIQVKEEESQFDELVQNSNNTYQLAVEKHSDLKVDFGRFVEDSQEKGDYFPVFWTFKFTEQEHLPELRQLLNQQIDALQNENLTQHQKTADKARDSIVLMFRKDIVANLQGKFLEMREQIGMINAALRDKVLHNQRYELAASPDSSYSSLISYIRKTQKEDMEATNDLFDTIPDDVMETINEIIDSNTGNDYREYFNYDFVLTDLKSGQKTKLSKLLNSGSGGEKQTPLYIAISSALASAWKSDKGSDGAALALFDEAFNKLDAHNLKSAMGFMDDAGIQLVLAAPDNKEQDFKDAGVDTIIYITRDGEAVDLDIEVLGEKAKSISANNPLANETKLGELVDKEMELVDAG